MRGRLQIVGRECEVANVAGDRGDRGVLGAGLLRSEGRNQVVDLVPGVLAVEHLATLRQGVPDRFAGAGRGVVEEERLAGDSPLLKGDVDVPCHVSA
ncbi:hypothetical protein D9M72_599700 [compost metagenome]